MKMSRDELKKAFRESISQEFSAIPATDAEIDYIFSPRFESKMNRLIRTQKRPGKQFKTRAKKVWIIVAVIVLLLATAFCIPPVRDAITGFFVSTYNDHIELEPSGDNQIAFEHEFFFSQIPEGFTLTDESRTLMAITKTYSNANGERILLDQSLSTKDGAVLVDNEKSSIWSQTVGTRGVQFRQCEDEMLSASWMENDCVVTIYYYGVTSVDYMIALIESVI